MCATALCSVLTARLTAYTVWLKFTVLPLKLNLKHHWSRISTRNWFLCPAFQVPKCIKISSIIIIHNSIPSEAILCKNLSFVRCIQLLQAAFQLYTSTTSLMHCPFAGHNGPVATCLTAMWETREIPGFIKALHTTRHKNRSYFGDILPSQSLALVWKKLNLTQH